MLSFSHASLFSEIAAFFCDIVVFSISLSSDWYSLPSGIPYGHGPRLHQHIESIVKGESTPKYGFQICVYHYFLILLNTRGSGSTIIFLGPCI